MHEGHRQRLKLRFINESLNSFDSHQILELLLFFSIPRKDTNEIAHALIKRFGSLAGVFEAPLQELISIQGITENSAILLNLIPQISRIYLTNKHGEKFVISSSKKAGEFAVSLFTGQVYEMFYLICLDSQNRINHADLVHKGTINEAPIYPRIIVETALRHKANNVILAHNHPGGSLWPSSSDIEATKKIVVALDAISIKVLDHIIVADNKYISFIEKGLL